MMDSIENRKTTVEWLWSLFNVMKCVAVAEAHKEDFNNVKLYAEYSHDAVAGLNPCTLAEHEANVKLTLQSWESLQRPIKLASPSQWTKRGIPLVISRLPPRIYPQEALRPKERTFWLFWCS